MYCCKNLQRVKIAECSTYFQFGDAKMTVVQVMFLALVVFETWKGSEWFESWTQVAPMLQEFVEGILDGIILEIHIDASVQQIMLSVNLFELFQHLHKYDLELENK